MVHNNNGVKKEESLNDHFAEHLGMTVLERQAGYARVAVTLNKNLMNGVGLAHGGLIFTLADYAFALACNTYERRAVSVSASINYIYPGKAGILTAEGKVVSENKKMGHYTITVSDESETTIAVMSGLAYYSKRLILEKGHDNIPG